MSVFRRDPTTNEWVILAPRRAQRPHGARRDARSPGVELDPVCPFCPENEDDTPPEISRRPLAESGAPWRVRVFPNLYPAVTPEGSGTRSGGSPFQELRGRGAHEVVVESPRHNARLDEMSLEEVSEVVAVWHERYQALGRLQTVRSVIVFKNFGAGAGTSLLHAHSQILAVPVYPPRWMHALGVSMRYFDQTGTNVYDDVVSAERAARTRVVTETDGFIAFCPFASTSPYEVWIMPNDRRSSFGTLTEADVPALADLIREVLGRLRSAAEDPDFNLVVHSAPAESPQGTLFRWHIKVLPRITLPAGFELGSGIGINPLMPEDAAEALRRAPSG